MSIDPTYHRRLVNGDFNASSPVADICLQSESEFSATTPESPLADRRNGVLHNGRNVVEVDFSPSSTSTSSAAVSIPAYARDPRLSQDLSTLFPPVSPRNGGATAAGNGVVGEGGDAPKKRSQFTGCRDIVSPIIGDPFVEEDVGWMDEEAEMHGDSSHRDRTDLAEEEGEDADNNDLPQPFMLVRGTKRATLRQSQATAAATSIAKENAGKKKRDKNACKTQWCS